MTAIISIRATTTKPIVPANESNILSQYSPAPVQKMKPTIKQNRHTTPVTCCFLTRLMMSMSNRVHNMPSSMPICEPRPRDSSMVKKSTAQNGAPGSSTMAWVKTMKARPVPSAA